MKLIAKYQIYDTFVITGRGLVLVGKIIDGNVFLTGDFIEFEVEGVTFNRKIIGVDNEMRVSEAKPKVGVMIETKDDKEISDLRNWTPEHTIGKIYSNR